MSHNSNASSLQSTDNIATSGGGDEGGSPSGVSELLNKETTLIVSINPSLL